MTVFIIFAIVLAVAAFVLRTMFKKARAEAAEDGEELTGPSVLGASWLACGILSLLCFGTGLFQGAFFYAEPGYIYHIRTIAGTEDVVINETGFRGKWFGKVDQWKAAMTVQASASAVEEHGDVSASKDSTGASVNLKPLNVIFLDNVDADASASTRFRLPTSREAFLLLAHEYRTPENLLRTELIPAFQETLKATASLMSAEEYYSGARTQFQSDFEEQMENGVFMVKRKEVIRDDVEATTGSANAALGTEQEEFGDVQRISFEVEKLTDPTTGQPIRKEQKFVGYDISVVAARVTGMLPNEKYLERMKLKQQASADRAVAREKRIQMEEERLLAVAEGERQVAEAQAKWKADQMEKTTQAETEKQLAITEAEKLKESAMIAKETAEIELEKSKIEAEAIEVTADAEAHARKVVLEADNALEAKLKAEVEIQQLWAEAYAKRTVPGIVFGGGGENGAPVGADDEVTNFMKLMTVDAATRLNYDRGMVPVKPTAANGTTEPDVALSN